MSFSEAHIRANMEHFAHKLRTEKSRATVLHAVEDNKFDFVLLDTRGREAFANGHIPGALCAPMDELDKLSAVLPRDKEIITYCWGHD
jgi:rhodanese-related sulfurtransferase